MRSMTFILSESSRLIRAVFLLGVMAFSIASADTTELNHSTSTQAAYLEESVVTGVAEMLAYLKCAGEIILSLNISNATGSADAEDTTGLTYLKCSGKIIMSVNSPEPQLSTYREYAGEITVHATNATITEGAGVTTEQLNIKWIGEITASLNVLIVNHMAPHDSKCGRDIIEDIRVLINSTNATRSEDVGFNTSSRVVKYMYAGVIAVSTVDESENIHRENQLPKCPRTITMTLEATSATSSEGANVSTHVTTESGVRVAEETTALQGTTSATGSTGPGNSTALAGITGAKETTGLLGVTSATGSSGPGNSTTLAGVTGAKETTGLQGATSATGEANPRDNTTPSGIKGAKETTGLQGATSATGGTGPGNSTTPSGIKGAEETTTSQINASATGGQDIQTGRTVDPSGTLYSTQTIKRSKHTEQSQDAKDGHPRKKISEANYVLFLTIPIGVSIVGLVTYFVLISSTNEPEKRIVLIPMEEGNAGNASTIGVSSPIPDKDIIKDEAH